MNKKLWRCNVCNDIHYGLRGPVVCPTCAVENAYVEVDRKEAANLMDLTESEK